VIARVFFSPCTDNAIGVDVLQIDHEQGHCLVVLSKRCEYLYERALDSRCMLDLLDDELKNP
jgi:hypothetical protein